MDGLRTDGAGFRNTVSGMIPQPMADRFRRAAGDMAEGTLEWRISTTMAWMDIRQRYRGSLLGPFWLTLSMAIMIGALGVVYSTLLHTEIATYLPYLTTGIVVWTFISTVLLEGCNCFIHADAVLRQVRMPFTVHVYRTLYRNLIVLAHNAVVYVVVALLFGLKTSAGIILVLPALAILVVNGLWTCLLLGMICARFRDVGPIVGAIIQIVFFITPILWHPGMLNGAYAWIVFINPFHAMIDVVRAPLLGEPVSLLSWAVILTTTLAGVTATFLFFARFRARIPYWA